MDRAGVVLVAAGSGHRFGGAKQFARVAGRCLIDYPLRTFHRTPLVGQVVVVVPADRVAWMERHVRREGFFKVRRVVAGGSERADSVAAGIRAMAPLDVVLVHDAARPLVTRPLIERVIHAARRTGAALAARPVPDTIKRGVRRRGRVCVRRTVPRDDLWLAQTPQGFRADVLARLVRRRWTGLSDDVQAAERRGWPVEMVEGSSLNFKVTVPEDLTLCRALAGRP